MRAAGLDGVADVFAEGVEGDGSERDLVGTARCVSLDDFGFDRAAQRREAPAGHGVSVELDVVWVHTAATAAIPVPG